MRNTVVPSSLARRATSSHSDVRDLDVEPGRGLVEEEDAGVVQQGEREVQPAAHAAEYVEDLRSAASMSPTALEELVAAGGALGAKWPIAPLDIAGGAATAVSVDIAPSVVEAVFAGAPGEEILWTIFGRQRRDRAAAGRPAVAKPAARRLHDRRSGEQQVRRAHMELGFGQALRIELSRYAVILRFRAPRRRCRQTGQSGPIWLTSSEPSSHFR